MIYLKIIICLILAGSMASCTTIPVMGDKFHPKTSDGWDLTMEHVPPAKGSTPRKYPVILCHGLMMNRNCFKTNGDNSLPIMLSKAGYDVWLLDLRGRYDAGRPGMFFGEHTYTYCIDDYIKYDMDTAIKFVLEKTGADKVNWIGHSMGGIIPYSRIGSYSETRVANLVTIASLMFVAPISRSFIFLNNMRGGMPLLPAMMTAPLLYFTPTIWPNLITRNFTNIVYYNDNNDPEALDIMLTTAGENIAKPELRQFMAFITERGAVSADLKISYRDNLKNVKIPVLALAGRRDNLCDPLTIRDAYEKLGSKDKTFVMFSKADGFAGDYNHMELIMGKKAHIDVHPIIIKWLDARTPVSRGK
jgi:pimeloyl-ACP methyl ester carboxylesterase